MSELKPLGPCPYTSTGLWFGITEKKHNIDQLLLFGRDLYLKLKMHIIKIILGFVIAVGIFRQLIAYNMQKNMERKEKVFLNIHSRAKERCLRIKKDIQHLSRQKERLVQH